MTNRLRSFLLVFSLLIYTALFLPVSTYAATFRSGDTVMINETLADLYTAGGTISIDAPITNDLTIAGGTLNINERVTGGILAAGGTLNIEGPIGNTIRAVGGTIRITGPIGRDAVLAGGNITLDESASVSGDLVVTGGQINIQSPVQGNVIVNGGQVTVNAPVGGNVEGEVGALILGNRAVINGDLNYASSDRATIRDGARILGQENFRKVERDDSDKTDIAGLVTGWSLYKLIADILGSLALIYLLYTFSRRVVERGVSEPLKNGLLGLATLFLGPILALFLLVLILPGVLTFLLYGLLLLIAMFIGKLLIGWILLRWWYGRDKRIYVLDWKAAVLGPIAMYVLLWIPIIGWFTGFVIFLIALGSLAAEIFSWVSSPKNTEPRSGSTRTKSTVEAATPVQRSSRRPAARRTTTKKR